MKKIKIYIYYWLISIFFILLSAYWFWLKSNDAIIDINVHDTYYVIHNSHISILLAVIYAFLGLVYYILRLTKVILIKCLTNIHSILSLGIIPIYFIGYFILSTRKHSQFPFFDDTSSLMGFSLIIWLIFLITQLILMINLIISLAKLLFNKK